MSWETIAFYVHENSNKTRLGRLIPIDNGEVCRQPGTPTWFPNQGKAAASYHIGVIDILQEWNWEKRMERFAKALLGARYPRIPSTCREPVLANHH